MDRPLSLSPHEGDVIDALLDLAADRGTGDLAATLSYARRGLRSERPGVDYVWPAAVQSVLQDLVKYSDETASVKELLLSCIDIASGSEKALDAARRFSISTRSIAFDPNLELAQFRTTRSFDLIQDKVQHHLSSGDNLSVLIKGHLWVEASMRTILRRRIRSNEHLDRARLSFSQLAELCASMALLAEDEYVVIKKLNRLRNELAHQVDFSVGPDEQKALVDVCSGRIRQIAGVLENYEFPDAMVNIAATLVILIHGRVDQIDAAGRYDEYLHLRVQEVLRR